MNLIEEIITKMKEILDDPEMQDGWDAFAKLEEWLNEKQSQPSCD